jgi:hypothetical protein
MTASAACPVLADGIKLSLVKVFEIATFYAHSDAA